MTNNHLDKITKIASRSETQEQVERLILSLNSEGDSYQNARKQSELLRVATASGYDPTGIAENTAWWVSMEESLFDEELHEFFYSTHPRASNLLNSRMIGRKPLYKEIGHLIRLSTYDPEGFIQELQALEKKRRPKTDKIEERLGSLARRVDRKFNAGAIDALSKLLDAGHFISRSIHAWCSLSQIESDWEGKHSTTRGFNDVRRAFENNGEGLTHRHFIMYALRLGASEFTIERMQRLLDLVEVRQETLVDFEIIAKKQGFPPLQEMSGYVFPPLNDKPCRKKTIAYWLGLKPTEQTMRVVKSRLEEFENGPSPNTKPFEMFGKNGLRHQGYLNLATAEERDILADWNSDRANKIKIRILGRIGNSVGYTLAAINTRDPKHIDAVKQIYGGVTPISITRGSSKNLTKLLDAGILSREDLSSEWLEHLSRAEFRAKKADRARLLRAKKKERERAAANKRRERERAKARREKQKATKAARKEADRLRREERERRKDPRWVERISDADLHARAVSKDGDIDELWREARRRNWSRRQMIAAFEA